MDKVELSYCQISKKSDAALLAGVLLALCFGLTPVAAHAQDPDLPTGSATAETLPQGSLVIPMDDVLQSEASDPFNLTAYGLVAHILHADIPVKWIIKNNKALGDTDFTANASMVRPSAGTSASTSFKGGPFVVHARHATAALAVIDAFRTNATVLAQNAEAASVAVYRLDQNVTADVRYTLRFKPVVAVMNDGTNKDIHYTVIEYAGFVEGTHYQGKTVDILAADLTSLSCYSAVSEPHTDQATIEAPEVAAMKVFLNSGGNMLAQCHAVQAYETETPPVTAETGQLLTTAGVTVGNAADPPFTYSNADLAFSQITGTLDDQGGSGQDWLPTASTGSTYQNNAHLHVEVPGVGHRAWAGKLQAGNGGTNIFYLGGHSYGTGGALSVMNGQRMYLNAMMVPAKRPGTCALDVTEAPAVEKSSTLITDGNGNGLVDPGDRIEYTITITNHNPLSVAVNELTNVVLTDNIPTGTAYVPGTTTYALNGGAASAVSDEAAPPAATAFPLDGSGYAIGTIYAKDYVTITFRVDVDAVIPPGDGEVVNTATATSDQGTGQATDTIVLNGVSRFSISKTSDAVADLLPGDVVTYTITVTNESSTTQTAVAVTDPLPAGVGYVGGSTEIYLPDDTKNALDRFETVAYTNNDGSINWTGPWTEIGEATDPAAGNVMITTDGSANVLQVTRQDNGIVREVNLNSYTSATLSYTYRRFDTNAASKETLVQVSGNGGASWTTVNTIVGDGIDASYQSASHDITAYMAADTQVRIVNNSLNDKTVYFDDVEIVTTGTAISGSAPPTLASGQTLDAGDQMVVTFQVTVDDPITPSIDQIVNTATVTSTQDPTGNSAQVSDPVSPFTVEKTAALVNDLNSDGLFGPGDTVEYTITTKNIDDAAITGVVLTDNVPANTTYVAGTTKHNGSPVSDQFTPPAATAFPLDESGYAIGTVSAGATATVTFRVTINTPLPGGTTEVINTATVTTDQGTLQASVTTPLVPIPSDGITKTSNAVGDLTPGQTLTYTVTVTNTDVVDWTNVAVTDNLPAGLTYVPASTSVTINNSKNVRDEFTTVAYTNNHGSMNWNGPWIEIGESDGASGGDIKIAADLSDNRLQIKKNSKGAVRAVDLSGAASATLSFKYRRNDTNDINKTTLVQVSSTGAAPWTTLMTITGETTDVAYQTVAGINISAHTTANTAIRFVNNSLNDKTVFFDDVDVTATYVSNPAGGAPPTLISGQTLEPGAVMTVTFNVTVDAPPVSSSITNVAAFSSDQTSSRQAFVTDPVADVDSDDDGIPNSVEDLNGDGDFTNDDTDGDGHPNYLDIDSDDDGITDKREAGPTPATPRDSDSDGIPDHLDLDADDDGLPDNVEGQTTAGYTAPTGTDTDGDGLDDAYDLSDEDADNNGIPESYDSDASGGITPNDHDADTTPDYLDADSDDDGRTDAQENGDPQSTPSGTDTDGDGLDDAFDDVAGRDVNDDIANPATDLPDSDADVGSGGDVDFRDTTPDSDLDGIADPIDLDDDNDGIPDVTEGGGADPSADHDSDGTPNYLDTDYPGFTDANSDGVDDAVDFDRDGVPNHLDRDADNDGILDLVEAGGADTDGDGVHDTMTDTDGDGIPDSVDVDQTAGTDTDGDGIDDTADVDQTAGTDTDGDGIDDASDPDRDGDGLADAVDSDAGGTPLEVPNSDGTGGADYLDIDADGDGIPDNIEGQSTAGFTPPTGTDTDGDGIDDAYDTDSGNAGIDPYDYDTDSTPDYLDDDSDADGSPDIQEGHDFVHDGEPDYEPTGTDTDGDGLDDGFEGEYGTSYTPGQTANPSNGVSVTNTDLPNNGGGGSNVDFRNSGVLPVELVSFEALLDGTAVLLSWTTASETNNAGFFVEINRTPTADAFEQLTFVEGHGTIEEAQTYRYRLAELAPGTYRFRLKQIDYDGTFDYSPEVEITVEMAERFLVEPVYPNPFNPQATFRFAVRQQQAVRVELFDVLGRRVALLYAGEPEAGQMQTVRIDGAGLPSGRYLVRVLGEGFVRTQTVTLVK